MSKGIALITGASSGIGEALARHFADKGFDSDYGARPLKRAIQKYIEDALAEEIINSNLKEGDAITMDLDDKKNELSIKIKKQKKKTTES